MQTYLIEAIKERKLSWENKEDLVKDEQLIRLKNEGAGLEPMAYFVFKLSIENDRRYAFETLDKFDDFKEFLPITQTRWN